MPTTPHSEMQAQLAFARAARARRRASLLCRLRRGNGTCGALPVYAAQPRPSGANAAGAVRPIPLEAISGTVEPNRTAQFDRDLRPATSVRTRWERVWLAEDGGTVLPPISVVHVGGSYAIRDGHHRVSVAKARGALTIDAFVDAG